MVRPSILSVALAPRGDVARRPFWSRKVTHRSTRELGIMTHSSTQTGSVPIGPVVALGQGTTWNLPPAMETIEPTSPGTVPGTETATPSRAISCTTIGLPVWSPTSRRSQLKLPAPVPSRQISPSGLETGMVGNWVPLTVKYHTPPVKLSSPLAVWSTPAHEPWRTSVAVAGNWLQNAASVWPSISPSATGCGPQGTLPHVAPKSLVPAAATWTSLSSRWRTLASGHGAGLTSPVTMSPTLPMVSSPDVQCDSCSSAMPCKCAWYQSRPEGWFGGTGIL